VSGDVAEPNGDPIAHPVEKRVDRRGFLPIRTNAFDRGFIAVVLFIAIHLLWMRFVEAQLSLYVATALSLAVGYVIVRYG
jgi:predicted small integral membrane protein